MASFVKAYEMGADLLELDVRLSRDEALIVMHDPDVSRTTTGRGRVCDLTVDEIRRLDAGVKFGPEFAGERVPLLEEVLDWAKGRIQLVVEMKGDPIPTPRLVEKVVAAIRSFGMVDEVMVISFHHPAVKLVKEIEPRIATGILFTGQPVDPVAMARAARADSVRPSWPYWTAEMVARVHEAGLVAHSWNANDEPLMEYLVSMGLDSIGSDYPDRLRAYVDRVGRGWRR